MFSQHSTQTTQAMHELNTKGNAVIIRVWRSGPHGGRDVGHVSMEFGDTYISFWPKYDDRKPFTFLNQVTLAFEKKEGDFKASYYHDLIAEKRFPETTIYLHTLNIDEMQRAFIAAKNKNPKWHMGAGFIQNSKSNCSGTVMKILQAGGISNLLSDSEKNTLKKKINKNIHAPWQTEVYARSASNKERTIYSNVDKLNQELDHEFRESKIKDILELEFDSYLNNFAHLAKKNNFSGYRDESHFSNQQPVIVRSWLRGQAKNRLGKISLQIGDQYFFFNKKGIYKGTCDQHLAKMKEAKMTTYFHNLDTQKIIDKFAEFQNNPPHYFPQVSESDNYCNSVSFAFALLKAGGMTYDPPKLRVDGTYVNKMVLKAKIKELTQFPATAKLDLKLNPNWSDFEKMAIRLIAKDACREKCLELDTQRPASVSSSSTSSTSILRRNSIFPGAVCVLPPGAPTFRSPVSRP